MDRSNQTTGDRSSGRTSADACAVLTELGRALRGWQFYRDDARTRSDLLDRAFRALEGELHRNGPLALEVRRETFWLAGSDLAVGAGRLDELARHVSARGVARLVLESELDANSLAGLLDALASEPGVLASCGGIEALLYAAPRRGLSVNETHWRTHAATAPEARAALTADAAAVALTLEPEATDAIELLEVDAAPTIEESPLEADPSTGRALELVERLRELADCDDEGRYRDLVRDVGFAVQALVEDDIIDEAFRALCVLAEHAGDDAKRSFAIRESAAEGLRRLAQGLVLADLVRRAGEPEGDASVHATAVLREIGARAVPLLLERLDAAIDSERRARLTGVLLAMGEEAAPALAEAIDSGPPRRQRLALKLAGETQNPRLVPNLRDALLGGSEEVAREAALALARISDVSSLETLAEALGAMRGEVAAIAAFALGSSGRVLAVAPLADALARALETNRLTLARELVRALGRLGRPEATGALAALIGRGGFFQRRKLRELKLAAVTALASLPGRDAVQALTRAARSADGKVRQTASLALERRQRTRSRAA